MYNRKDAYYHKAKQEGYKSRAAYKLKELNQKYKLFKRKSRVLDAGAAPGGWSQVALEYVKEGLVVGVDLLDVDGITNRNFRFIKGDLTEQSTLDKVTDICDEYDVVISDAAPNTSGQKLLDHVNSVDLVTIIFEFAKKVLKKDGSFAFKLFEGEDRPDLVKSMRPYFETVKLFTPQATRKNSFEMYIICRGFKGES